MSWGEDEMVGHINTFATPGWQTPRQSGMGTLAGYCAALSKVPEAVSTGFLSFRPAPRSTSRFIPIAVG